MDRLGPSTLVKDAFNAIDYEGVVPIVIYHQYMYLISTDGQDTGNFYYTKFTELGEEAIHSVVMPFSYAHRLAEIIDRGEGLRPKIVPPTITELPPEVIAQLNS